MAWRKGMAAVGCLAIMTVSSGCPLTGSMVAGIWDFYVDTDCDGADGHLGILLKRNGVAELHGGQIITGTWNLDGALLTVSLTSPSVVTFQGTLTNSTTLANGTISGGSSGCWTGSKLQ